MDSLADETLVDMAKKGNLDAFATLVKRYEGRIYRMIIRMTHNHDDTDDLLQETFLYAFKALKDFQQKSSFYTWIYRIAANLTINHLKRRRREKGRENHDDISSLADVRSPALSPESCSIKKEFQEKLREAVAYLPLPYRMCFELVVLQGMSHGQAAQVLRCSENTISWRMHKIRKMLQGQLRSYINGVQNEV